MTANCNFCILRSQYLCWEKICRELVKETRIQNGRNPKPSYALIDSQSVKTTYNSENRGYDGGKKRK